MLIVRRSCDNPEILSLSVSLNIPAFNRRASAPETAFAARAKTRAHRDRVRIRDVAASIRRDRRDSGSRSRDSGSRFLVAQERDSGSWLVVAQKPLSGAGGRAASVVAVGHGARSDGQRQRHRERERTCRYNRDLGHIRIRGRGAVDVGVVLCR